MNRIFHGAVLAVALSCVPLVVTPALYPQDAAGETHPHGDLTGNWQGTLQVGNRSLRIIAILKKEGTATTGQIVSLDQNGARFKLTTVSVEGDKVKFTSDLIGLTADTALDSAETQMTGTWKQGDQSLPLTLTRATKTTMWEVPSAPTPPTPMAADASPDFDVATIKPDKTGATSLHGLSVQGRNVLTRASSLMDILCFAYNVQPSQVINAPDWVSSERFDIDGVPDVPGSPNMVQLRGMFQKLIQHRFGLVYHNDKRQLAAYVLSQAKGGVKLKANEGNRGNLPGMGFRPVPNGVQIPFVNATMDEVTSFLQSMIVDRPVLNQTEMQGRYDFSLKFAPDDSQFHGHPPVPLKKDESAEVPPSIYEAMQHDLGLKLEPQKTMVPVIVIDKVNKASDN